MKYDGEMRYDDEMMRWTSLVGLCEKMNYISYVYMILR